jgi:biopolymer transport protein ExbD
MKEVTISLTRGRKARVEGDVVAFEKLRHALEKHKEDDTGQTVIKMICDPGVTMSDVYDVQTIMTKLDLMKVNFVTKSGEGMPLILPPFDVEERLSKIDPHDKAIVMVNAAGTIGPENEAREPAELEEVLEQRIARNPRLIVIIRTALETKYEDFLEVLRHVKAAGAQRIVIDAPGAN